MLGSEYAQLGMIEEAKDSMARAVDLDPGFPIARFQLGMLHLTSGDPQTALVVWEPLAVLDDRHPQAYLVWFERGMRHLIAGEFGAAVQALRGGVCVNQDNEPLSADMNRLVASIEQSMESGGSVGATAPSQPSSEADAALNHLFISAYAKSGLPH
jgi:tetratricopeptide (TPR) repeat protein